MIALSFLSFTEYKYLEHLTLLNLDKLRFSNWPILDFKHCGIFRNNQGCSKEYSKFIPRIFITFFITYFQKRNRIYFITVKYQGNRRTLRPWFLTNRCGYTQINWLGIWALLILDIWIQSLKCIIFFLVQYIPCLMIFDY